MNSTPPHREHSTDDNQDPLTAERDHLTASESKTFWTHVKESICRNHFISVFVFCLYAVLYMDKDEIGHDFSTHVLLGAMAGLVCVAFAITTVCQNWWPKNNQDVGVFSEGECEPPKDANAETNQKIRNEVMVLGLIVIVLRSCGLLPDSGNTIAPPPVVMPPQQVITPTQPTAERCKATLAYWNATVGNLHEVRFKDPSSDNPSEQVVADILSRLKTLTDQANVAPWDNVDQDLVSMVIRHSFIDKSLFQLKTTRDEWLTQNPSSNPQVMSFNEAGAHWQSFVTAVQSDAELLNKLPEGPLRKLIVSVLEYEQQRVEQFHEIDAMQATLQERYPDTTFPLPEIGQ